MPATIDISLQVVNGDPATSGGNINITTSTLSAAVANEDGVVSLSSVASNDTLTIGGLDYSYEFLGSGDVNGDASLPAAFIRIVGPLPAGSTLAIGDTFAIDLTGEPGDPDYPNLPNGNTKLQVGTLDTTTEIQFPGFVCFVRGSRIETPSGPINVEDIQPGDLVQTLDHGPQPVRLIVSKELRFGGPNEGMDQKPIEFKTGSLGPDLPTRTLCVSQQHRMLVRQNDEEVLVPAKGLLNQTGVRLKKGCRKVEYFHIIFDQHEVVFSEGVPTESFFPGAQAIAAMEQDAREELNKIFPELSRTKVMSVRTTARPVIPPSQAKRLLETNALVASC